MDGYKKKKTNLWRKNYYSNTRYPVILWLEKHLPKITGDVLNVGAGGWPVPRQLLTNPRLGKYFTVDKKLYGDSKNPVDLYCDAHNLPKDWNDKWNCVISNQMLECVKDPFRVTSEMYRVLKPGGVLLLDTPFNVSWFGYGANPDTLKKKFPVDDFWRITPQGVKMILQEAGFKERNIKIDSSGPNKYDPYCIMAKAVK